MAKFNKASEVVEKIIAEFVKLGPAGWIKGADAKDKNGCEVSPLSKKACSFCNEGVMFKVLGTSRRTKLRLLLEDTFSRANGSSMVSWNDYVSTLGHNLDGWFKTLDQLKAEEK